MEMSIRHGSFRSEKARLSRYGNGHWRIVAVAAICLLIVVGLAGLLVGLSIGWLVLSAAALPLMFVFWHSGELKHIPPIQPAKYIDDILVSEILAVLPKQPSPADIAKAVMQTGGGLFYALRFGITPNFLLQIASSEQSDSAEVWTAANDMREERGMSTITAGMLVYALVKQFPEHESLLAHNHIELSDIKKGIEWQQHLEALIEKHKAPKRTGGIARDWAFGYTPLLSRFGTNISEQIANNGSLHVDLESHIDSLDQIIDTFSSRGRQNIVLVGSAGVGKTTVVHALAERLLDASSKISSSLKFRQVVMLDAGALLSAAPGRGELEQLLTRLFSEAYAAKNIILCLDDAQLFFEDGIGSVDMSNVLLPIIEAGRLRLVLTMDEQRYLQISQRNSALVNALNRVSVNPATKEETIAVLQDQLILTEFSRHVTYSYQSIYEAYRLSERYVHDLAMPGRALRLLESAAGYSENGYVTMNSVRQAIEKTLGVKLGQASSEDERQKLLNLEELIHKRMINQTRAVRVVSDALRRARAGVRNENRPIGTFLFLGPTGVGKTELAKALADVYFEGEDRIVRIDLNEYVRNEDVSRLIADGSTDPSSLTSQLLKQPFSVVLLDEIEKAHPNVLTTLLQALDEGILRDINNREVSFRDAIIIATSNAGADRIREYIERGYKLDQFEQQFIDELINENTFRPEFLNRFDEIVTFTPLGKQELLQVVDLIIAGINKTLAVQKVHVAVEDSAKQLLVDKGYDPRLGARPMRRVVQKAVENTVAKQMLSGAASAGSEILITLKQVEEVLGKAEQVRNIEAEAKIDSRDISE